MANSYAPEAFSLKTAYFPRNDSVLAITRSMGEKGWKLAACPMFGGMGASWPCFLWQYTGKKMQTALVAIKDQSWPGKVCVGGVEPEVGDALLTAFKAMSGPEAQKGFWVVVWMTFLFSYIRIIRNFIIPTDSHFSGGLVHNHQAWISTTRTFNSPSATPK